MSKIDEAPPPMDPKLRGLLRAATGSFDAEASRHAEHAFDRLIGALPDVEMPPEPAGLAANTLAAKRLLPVMASVIISGAVGALTMYALGPVRERVVYVDRPTVSTTPPTTSAPMRSLRTDELPSASNAVPAPKPSSLSVTPSPSAQMAAERLLLDEARTAFASGDYDRSLDRLQRHKDRFAGGVLTEEREALAVRSLAALGKRSEAITRAQAFVARYPESIMRPAVEGAVSGL